MSECGGDGAEEVWLVRVRFGYLPYLPVPGWMGDCLAGAVGRVLLRFGSVLGLGDYDAVV